MILKKRNYIHAVEIRNLTAGNNVTVSLRIATDADFEVHKFTSTEFSLDPNVNPTWTVAIKNTGSDKDWQNIPIHRDNIVGTAELPNVLRIPETISKNTELTITFTNTSTATITYLQLAMHGLKLYNE